MQYNLTQEENEQIQKLIKEVLRDFPSVEKEDFLIKANLIAHELPYNLKAFLFHFKEYSYKDPICRINSFYIDEEKLQDTPSHWKERDPSSANQPEDVYLILCASILGNVFAWATEQNSNIVHEILPLKFYEKVPIVSSSSYYLEWHTEDSFHPLRGDYIGLLAMRNPTRTPTLVASTIDVDLTVEEYKILFEPIFEIRPDDSHLEVHNDLKTPLTSRSISYMTNLNKKPFKAPILFGDPKDPYLRLDPSFTLEPKNPKAKRALKKIAKEFNAVIKEEVLNPGDCLICDNLRAVHGRAPFKANYDGKDRWLKRVNITNDLRKSRHSRASEISRIIL